MKLSKIKKLLQAETIIKIDEDQRKAKINEIFEEFLKNFLTC